MLDKTKIGVKRYLKPYYVEDWEQTIYIKKINGYDMELLEKLTKDSKMTNTEGYILNIIIATCDANEKPIFTINDDVDLLKGVYVDVLAKIVKEIQDFNKTDEEELKKK